MEDEQERTEGVEVGAEQAAPDNPPSGDRGTLIEERYYQILNEHHFALNGMAGALMELKGRIDFLEETVFGPEPENE